MPISHKKDNVCVGVVINGFSFEQLTLLKTHIDRLSQSAGIVLIKHQPRVPAIFYQLMEVALLEKQANEQAKKDLYWAADIFHSSTIRYIFNGPRAVQVLRELPEIDCLIGHGLDKRHLSPQSSTQFIGNLRSFIETYRGIDKDNSMGTDDHLTCQSTYPAKTLFNEPNSKVMMRELAPVELEKQTWLFSR